MGFKCSLTMGGCGFVLFLIAKPFKDVFDTQLLLSALQFLPFLVISSDAILCMGKQQSRCDGVLRIITRLKAVNFTKSKCVRECFEL